MTLLIQSNKKKSVRFAPKDDKRNTLFIYEAYRTDVLWVEPEEFEKGREAAASDGRQLRHQGLDERLEDTFAALNDSSGVQRHLNEWAQGEGRGVERFACKNHFNDRRTRKVLAIDAILIAQHQAEERGIPLESITDQLRLLSLQFCVHAKIFARRMGKADEAVCYPKKKGTNRSISSSSLKKTNSMPRSSPSLVEEMSCPVQSEYASLRQVVAKRA